MFRMVYCAGCQRPVASRGYQNVPNEVTRRCGNADLLAGFLLFDGNDFVFSPGNILAKLYFHGGAGNGDLETGESQYFTAATRSIAAPPSGRRRLRKRCPGLCEPTGQVGSFRSSPSVRHRR